jgi:hypothetical protein
MRVPSALLGVGAAVLALGGSLVLSVDQRASAQADTGDSTRPPPAAEASTPLLADERTGQEDALADSLVGQWIEALGGMERYWNLQSARFTLTTEVYDRESGRLRRTRPRYVTIARLPTGEASRVERWEGDDFIQQGFDGQRTWAFMNGVELPDSAKDAREALLVARDVFYWFSLPYKLRDPGVFLRYRGQDEEGRHVVTVQFGEGVGEHQDTWMYRFLDDSVWPVEVNYIEEGRENLNRVRWENIQSVDGYSYPELRVHFDGQGRVSRILRYSDVEINPEVDAEIFVRP